MMDWLQDVYSPKIQTGKHEGRWVYSFECKSKKISRQKDNKIGIKMFLKLSIGYGFRNDYNKFRHKNIDYLTVRNDFAATDRY